MAVRADRKVTGSARGRPRHRSRAQYARQEFLLLPLSIVGVWIVLAVVVVVLDRNASGWAHPVHRFLSGVVSPQASSMLLSTITPGLLTVISIVFFVLIMAVQHQSTLYSPVVLDQFLRRQGNQVFFGTFVGLLVYCLLGLALVPPGQAVTTGTVAMLLSTATFVALVVFVYSAVDQVRPSSAMWMLQQLALRARAGQQPLLARCRNRAELAEAPTTHARSDRVGYIVHIDADRLTRALDRVTGRVEIEFRVAMGSHVVPGAVLAEVRGDDTAERDLLVEAVLDAVTLGRMRALERDTAQAVDNLGSMAWSATAASADPEGARIAVETLHSLLVEFQEQDRRSSAEDFGGPLPIVYTDHILGQILDGLTSVIIASGQSGQHQTASTVLTILCRAIPQLEPANQYIAVDRLQRVMNTMMNHAFTHDIETAFDEMSHSLTEAGLHDNARRIRELKTDLQQYNQLAQPDRDV